MPRAFIDKTIDGVPYQVGYLVSSDAIKTSTLVSKRLLPSVGKVLSGLGNLGNVKTALDSQLSSLNLDGAFGTLAGNLDPDELNTLMQKLCSVVIVKGEGGGLLDAQRIEEHFKGRPGHALKVTAASFEVNCSDFFGAAVSGASGGWCLKKSARF